MRVMRASKELSKDPYELLISVVGFDDNEGGSDDSESESGEEEEEESEGDEEEGENEEEEGEKPDLSKLKRALKEERQARRKADRELKRLQRENNRGKKQDEDAAAAARTEADEAKQRSQRLAVKLRQTAEDNLITRLATKMKFRDPDDALKLVDRTKFVVDQDDEEPDDIEIDEASINDALKELAKSKKHLLIASGDGEPSGGNLGSRSNKKDELDDVKLKEMYPTLRR